MKPCLLDHDNPKSNGKLWFWFKLLLSLMFWSFCALILSMLVLRFSFRSLWTHFPKVVLLCYLWFDLDVNHLSPCCEDKIILIWLIALFFLFFFVFFFVYFGNQSINHWFEASWGGWAEGDWRTAITDSTTWEWMVPLVAMIPLFSLRVVPAPKFSSFPSTSWTFPPASFTIIYPLAWSWLFECMIRDQKDHVCYEKKKEKSKRRGTQIFSRYPALVGSRR